ncbi:hypothetical protein EST38_g1905 [Candolleomyces aberdarensis]|uniref:Piwi domain-containing protein n=1 Tax=Candolleomyces aberdarensis TaxID=2316362 RepID=A0A4Q2DXE7_9AGAR|nr:hypothetical protein EST38_g1905 [Candolleomyces aberdarensis]
MPQVTTNSFEITRLPTTRYYGYDVSFSPAVEQKFWRKRTKLVAHLMMRVHPDLFPGRGRFLYDGAAIGYAHEALHHTLRGLRTFHVTLRSDRPADPTERGAYAITLKQASRDAITATHISTFVLQGTESDERHLLINFLQLLIRQTTNNLSDQKKAFFINESQEIQGSIFELRRGIFHSVRPALGRVTVLVDTTVAAFYQSIPLMDAMMTVLRTRNVRDLYNLNDQQWRNVTKLFKGVIIIEEKPDNRRRRDDPGRRRKILDFHRAGALFEFVNSDGMTVTIQEHYRAAYNIHLAQPRLPGVVLKAPPKHQRYEIVPMELCKIAPEQIYRKQLPEGSRDAMVRFSTLRPDDKKRRIQGVSESYDNCEAMKDAGMVVASRPMDVNATLLPTPKIKFGRNNAIDVRNGAWNVVSQTVYSTAGQEYNWAVLNLAPTDIDMQTLGRSVSELVDCARNLGIPLRDAAHAMAADPWGGPEALKTTLEQLMNEVARKAGGQALDSALKQNEFFVFVVLPKDAAGPRATVKFWGDMVHGIVTQCVRVDKFKNLRPGQSSQYWNNVLLKINARLRGENFKVQGSTVFNRFFSGSNPGDRPPPLTMIVGADVGHPGPNVRKPSVASLSFNQDRHGIRYGAISRIQEPRQEVIDDIQNMFYSAMNTLMAREGRPVSNIIVFRDGVSEGEYKRIAAEEIESIEATIGHYFKNHPKIKGTGTPLPKLTFVVVGKRHHTLLFPLDRNFNDGKGNCKAGVVVDEGIVQPNVNDFYLQSHSAIQGTSRSSHYIVLKDEVFGGRTRELQELAFSLCHIYAKATRSVSIPAPVYYADLACGRDSFHYEPGKEDDLRASDSASMTSGGEKVPFNLDPWKKEFKQRHGRLENSMYFL